MASVVTRLFLAILAPLVVGCVSDGGQQTHDAGARVLPNHLIVNEFDSRQWEIGYHGQNNREILIEWVVDGQTVERWTEMVTIHVQYTNVPISALTATVREQLATNCPSLEVETVFENPDALMWTWSHKGCNGFGPQREIRKTMRGTDGIYSLSYAVKEQAYVEAVYAGWMERITNAVLEAFPKEASASAGGASES